MRNIIRTAAIPVAFAAGLMLGRALPEPPPASGPAEPADGQPVLSAGEARSAPEPMTAAPGAEVQAEDWEALLARLDRLVLGGRRDAAEDLRQRLLATVSQRAREGQDRQARALLEGYLERNPHDPEAYLLASDLEQMLGRSDAALVPLFELLAFAADPAVVERARDRMRLLVNVAETRLVNAGDQPGLVRLYENLVREDPTYDGHRLRLAHWLLKARRLDEAERVLAETGGVGVDAGTRDDLAAEIRLARTRLPFERRDGALHVSATVAGQPLTLLVDTGATMTALSRRDAAALGARPTGRTVRVRTANGVVESEMHRIADLEVGDLRLESLTVLVLDGPLPDGVDGLLGMDVLDRFPALPGGGR